MVRRKQLKMTTSGEIRRAISRVANMVLNDEIDAKRANTILFGCNALLGAIRVDEQQKKLDELERLVMAEKQKPR